MVLMFLSIPSPLQYFFLSLLYIFVTTYSVFYLLGNMYICREKGLNFLKKVFFSLELSLKSFKTIWRSLMLFTLL